MPNRHPVLRNALSRRLSELHLMMHGIPAEEVYHLSDWEMQRDLILLQYMLEKQNNAGSD